jgi:hypothetical protein
MVSYCIVVNEPFLVRGIALHRSLAEHSSTPFRLFVLCVDQPSLDLLGKMEDETLTPLALHSIEERYPELRARSGERTAYEYIATFKPFLVRFLFEVHPEIPVLASLDADLLFFSDPSAVLDELKEGSVLLSPHHFSPHLKHLAVHGQFNGGFVVFCSDSEGKRAARWWAEQVLEWCADRVEGDKRSNQKYLESFPSLFRGVVSSQHPGINLAPWNIDSHRLSVGGEGILVDGRALVFYHFHHLRFLRQWLLDPALVTHKTRASHLLKHGVYAPYVRLLFTIQLELRCTHHFDAPFASVRYQEPPSALSIPLLLSRLFHRQWFIVWRGRIL